MIKKNWLYGALLIVSFPAFAADPPRPPAKSPGEEWQAQLKSVSPLKSFKAARCGAGPGGSCKIDVTMPAKCDKNLKPNPEILQIGAKVTVFWRISSGNWSFDATAGVKFDDPKAPFDEGRRLSDQVWKWKLKDGAPGGFYSYKMLLRSKDGQTCEVDPAIWV